jgi:hypothetical protein
VNAVVNLGLTIAGEGYKVGTERNIQQHVSNEDKGTGGKVSKRFFSLIVDESTKRVPERQCPRYLYLPIENHEWSENETDVALDYQMRNRKDTVRGQVCKGRSLLKKC